MASWCIHPASGRGTSCTNGVWALPKAVGNEKLCWKRKRVVWSDRTSQGLQVVSSTLPYLDQVKFTFYLSVSRSWVLIVAAYGSAAAWACDWLGPPEQVQMSTGQSAGTSSGQLAPSAMGNAMGNPFFYQWDCSLYQQSPFLISRSLTYKFLWYLWDVFILLPIACTKFEGTYQ